jgi:hypothetical protein
LSEHFLPDQAQHGRLHLSTLSIEPDKCFFHLDESGRLAHVGPDQLRCIFLILFIRVF